jgi:hypothetical protein
MQIRIALSESESKIDEDPCGFQTQLQAKKMEIKKGTSVPCTKVPQISNLSMSDGQPEVRNDTTAVRPDQDILGLDIPMCDGGLALGPEDLCMEVDESRNRGHEDSHCLQLSQRRPV